jgi:hypothetical protein
MRQAIPQTPPDYDRMRTVERPDGFYWRPKGTAREFGPFATLVEAVQDMQAEDGGAPAPGETLEEAESELGIADWIDPETGAPAEEVRPHLEEH